MDRRKRPLRVLSVMMLTGVLLASCEMVGDQARNEEEEKPMVSEQGRHSHHTIDYIELAVSDMGAAKRFYEAAFAWKFNDYGPDYAGIQKPGGGESGGLSLVSEVVPGGPLVILYSQDLDATLIAVREAGGRIVREPFSFPGGRRFHFQDPSGNELAVWSES